MKFKTRRDSETGKKFLKVHTKMLAAEAAAKKLMDELGAVQGWLKPWAVSGGLHALYFPKENKLPKGAYRPSGKSKRGKAMQVVFDALPKVNRHELNMCIGWKGGAPFAVISVNFQNPEYVLYTGFDKEDFPTPPDCQEITNLEYKSLIKK